MNTQEHLLTCLGEECAEIAQLTSKANRFGLLDINVKEPNGPTNQARLIAEMNDFLAVAELLVENRVIPSEWVDTSQIEAKKDRVYKFMLYARGRGALHN